MTATTATIPNRRTPSRTRSPVPLIGAGIFLVAYLAVDPVAGAIAPVPMPDAPAAQVYAYFTDHGAAPIVTGLLQLLSVAGFALFVASTLGGRRRSPHRRAGQLLGWIAVAEMVVSCAIAIILPVVAAGLSPATVGSWRQASFYAGGVAHVVALGGFALTIALWHAWTRPVRVMAWIAAIPALLSIASLLWYYASILLPVGRLLAMVACIVAAASLARGNSLAAGGTSRR